MQKRPIWTDLMFTMLTIIVDFTVKGERTNICCPGIAWNTDDTQTPEATLAHAAVFIIFKHLCTNY